MPADTIDFSRRKVWPLEHHEQQAFLRHCDGRGFPWTEYVSIPNEGKRGPRAQAILKANGVKKGFPDLLMLASDYGDQYKGLALEFKRQRWAYGKAESTWDAAIKPDQRLWRDRLVEQGWAHNFVYGAVEGAIALTLYEQGMEWARFYTLLQARAATDSPATLYAWARACGLDPDEIYAELPKRRATARRRKLPTGAGRKVRRATRK